MNWPRGILGILLIPIFLALSGEAALAKATIRYSHWGSQEEAAIHKSLVEAFMVKNPDIQVEIEHITGSYEQNLAVKMAGGSAPDVMFFQDEPFPAWVRKGVFEDLSPWFAKDRNINLRDYFPQTKEYFQYDGRQFALPSEGGPITIFFNKTLFDQAGLPVPPRNWGMLDFLDMAKKLSRDTDGNGANDRFGISWPGGWVYNEPFVWSFGAKYLDVGLPNREIAYARTNTPEMTQALKFLQEARSMHQVHGGNFYAGTAAMMITGPWGMIEARPRMAAAGFEWDLAHMPVGPTGKRATRQSFDTWVIWKESKNKEAGYRFVSYALSVEGQKEFITRAIPARIAAARLFIRPDTPQHEEVFFEIMQEYAWMQPTTVLYDAAGKFFDTWVNNVLGNKASPQEAAQRMHAEANGALMQLWPRNWQDAYKSTNTIPKDEAAKVFALDRQLRGGF